MKLFRKKSDAPARERMLCPGAYRVTIDLGGTRNGRVKVERAGGSTSTTVSVAAMRAGLPAAEMLAAASYAAGRIIEANERRSQLGTPLPTPGPYPRLQDGWW